MLKFIWQSTINDQLPGQGFSQPSVGQGFSLASSKPKGLPYIRIYDATGRLIRQWDYQSALGGMRLSDRIVWFGDDEFGRALPAGVYFCQLKTDAFNLTEKIVKLK